MTYGMPTSYQLRTLIKSCIINADRQQVQEHRQNAAWLLEYIAVYLCRQGYEMYTRERTVLRLLKRFIEYYYDLKPQLDIIKERDNIEDKEIALIFGYKTANAYRNAASVEKTKWFIKGYETGRKRMQIALSKAAAKAA